VKTYYYIAEKPHRSELRRSSLLFDPKSGGTSPRGTADRWGGVNWLSLNTFLNREDRRISVLELALLMPEVSA
jgi:hypothetical protein